MVVHALGLQWQGSTILVSALHRRRAISVLTRLQSASAAALAVFGVVHLSAPLVGLLHLGSGDVNDRVDAVSRWMLLGRVAYQSSLGEIVLWAALATHLTAGVAKRLITRFTTARPIDQVVTPTDIADVHATASALVPPSKPTSKLNTAHISGYILAPFAIHHAFVNRILPFSSCPPISSLSPSELDYSFVSHTLSHPNLPVRLLMATAYIALIGAFAVHTAYAVPALLRNFPRQSTSSSKTAKARRRSRVKISFSLALALLTSLLAIVPVRSSDRLTISGALKGRYDAVLRMAFPTRFFFRSS